MAFLDFSVSVPMLQAPVGTQPGLESLFCLSYKEKTFLIMHIFAKLTCFPGSPWLKSTLKYPGDTFSRGVTVLH